MGPNGSRRPKPEAPESARLVPARAWEEPALTIPGYAAFPIRLGCCTPGGDPGYRNPGRAGPATGANILSHSRGTATLFSPESNENAFRVQETGCRIGFTSEPTGMRLRRIYSLWSSHIAFGSPEFSRLRQYERHHHTPQRAGPIAGAGIRLISQDPTQARTTA